MAALALAAEAGPYFVIQPWSEGGQWRPLAAVLTDPVTLPAWAGQARRALAGNAGVAAADIEERVAASTVFLGLASQLVSPLLGATVLGGVVPQLGLGDLWWRPASSGLRPLAARPAAGSAVGRLDTDGQLTAAAGLLAGRVHGLTGPLAAAFGTRFRLSQQVLRGNAASALAGAAGVLAAQQPKQAAAAYRLAELTLWAGPLHDAGRFAQPDPAQPARVFVRRSCCLFYRVPGAGLCGDCVLSRQPRPDSR